MLKGKVLLFILIVLSFELFRISKGKVPVRIEFHRSLIIVMMAFCILFLRADCLEANCIRRSQSVMASHC